MSCRQHAVSLVRGAPAALLVFAVLVAACTEREAPTDPAERLGSDPPTPQAASTTATETSSTTDVPVTVLPDFTSGAATAIDNSSVVFGQGENSTFTDLRTRAFRWDGSGSPQQLEEESRESFVNDANEDGQVVGYVRHPSTFQHIPFIWSASTGPKTFDPPPGAATGGDAEAEGIDALGNVTGDFLPSDDKTDGVFFKPAGGSAFDIGCPSFSTGNCASSTDADGQGLVTGGKPAWTWDNEVKFTQFDGLWADAVNGTTVVGRAWNADENLEAAILSSSGEPVFLGTLGGSFSIPLAVNDDGWVVGYSRTSADVLHAFVWTPGTGMVDLGGLSAGGRSFAWDINNAGEIAGEADGLPVVWHFELPSTENQPPQIEAITDQTVEVGATLEVEPVVTDPEGDPFTLSWSGAPDNAILNGIFSFTPTEDQVGTTYEVTVTATQDDDATLSDSETFTVSVLAATEAKADMEVAVLPGLMKVVLGDEVPYTVTVHNAGPDPVQPGLTVELEHRDQSEWGTVPSDAILNGLFVLDLGEVAAGETVEVPLGVVYNAFGVHEVTASVAGDFTDSDPSNNTDLHEQVVDLPIETLGVVPGGLTFRGETTDGEPLAVVGLRIAGELIAGDWPDVFIPVELTPRSLLPPDQWLPEDEYDPWSEFIPGDMYLPGDMFIPGDMYVLDRTNLPDPSELPGDMFIPGDMYLPGDMFLPGKVFRPGRTKWEPRGRLIFSDEDAGGVTDVAIIGRPEGSPDLLLEDVTEDGLKLTATNGDDEELTSFCSGTFDAVLDDGDIAVLTCGSLTAEVIAGEVRLELDDGTLVFVPAGSAVEILEDGAGGWDVVVLAGGGVTVLPIATLQTLQADVDGLLDDGTLNRGQHNGLSVKIEQADDLLDREKTAEAVKVLEDLRQQILDLEAEGVLSPSQRDALGGAVERIIYDVAS